MGPTREISPTRAGLHCQRTSYTKWPVPCKLQNVRLSICHCKSAGKCEPAVLGENLLNMPACNREVMVPMDLVDVVVKAAILLN